MLHEPESSAKRHGLAEGQEVQHGHVALVQALLLVGGQRVGWDSPSPHPSPPEGARPSSARHVDEAGAAPRGTGWASDHRVHQTLLDQRHEEVEGVLLGQVPARVEPEVARQHEDLQVLVPAQLGQVLLQVACAPWAREEVQHHEHASARRLRRPYYAAPLLHSVTDGRGGRLAPQGLARHPVLVLAASAELALLG
eukprot:3229613-Pyramimonas_sp.AAC.2